MGITAPTIEFHPADTSFRLKNIRRVKQAIFRLFETERSRFKTLQVIFCTDNYLLSINREFLQHDYYTDIISFNLGQDDEPEIELYISVDRVRDNARELGLSFYQEMIRVIFHGCLHFCGYSDENDKNRSLMREAEDRHLSNFECFT